MAGSPTSSNQHEQAVLAACAVFDELYWRVDDAHEVIGAAAAAAAYATGISWDDAWEEGKAALEHSPLLRRINAALEEADGRVETAVAEWAKAVGGMKVLAERFRLGQEAARGRLAEAVEAYMPDEHAEADTLLNIRKGVEFDVQRERARLLRYCALAEPTAPRVAARVVARSITKDQDLERIRAMVGVS